MLNLFSIKLAILAGVLSFSCIGQSISDNSVSTFDTSRDYPISPVSFANVHLTDNFWEPRIDKMFSVTIPHELELNTNDSTGIYEWDVK